MSNFPFLNHQSPIRRKRPEPALVVKPATSNVVVRSTSIKITHDPPVRQKIQTSQNTRPLEISENVNTQRRNISPTPYHPPEERKMPQQSGRNDINGHQAYHSRDSSPLGRAMWHNEPQRYFPPNFGNRENKERFPVEREGSWDKLLKRPEEEVLNKDKKLYEWRRLLEEQIQEKQVRKQAEEQQRKNEEMHAEHRYQKQIQELSKDFVPPKQREQSVNKNYPEEQFQESPLQMNYNSSNYQLARVNIRSHKNLLSHRDNQFPMESKNEKLRAKRGQSSQREDYSWNASYSVEKEENKPKTDKLNQYIDNLREEILQSQKIFKNEIKDLANEVYKSARFRNVAERNILGAQRIGSKQGGPLDFPTNPTYEKPGNSFTWRLPTEKPTIIRPKNMNASVLKDEEKLQWDNDDFYSKLNNNTNNTRLVEVVRTMVKIQPVTEDLLAYKKPEKYVEALKEKQEQAKEEIKQDGIFQITSQEGIVKPKEEIKTNQTISTSEYANLKDQELNTATDKANNNKYERSSLSKAGSQSSIFDEKIKSVEKTKQTKVEEEESIGSFKRELTKLPSIMLEYKDTLRMSRANSQINDESDRQPIKSSSKRNLDHKNTISINIFSPKNAEKNTEDDFLRINENLHSDLKEADLQNRQATPSVSDRSKKELSQENQGTFEKILMKEVNKSKSLTSSQKLEAIQFHTRRQESRLD